MHDDVPFFYKIGHVTNSISIFYCGWQHHSPTTIISGSVVLRLVLEFEHVMKMQYKRI
jgi:hypothetical protein